MRGDEIIVNMFVGFILGMSTFVFAGSVLNKPYDKTLQDLEKMRKACLIVQSVPVSYDYDEVMCKNGFEIDYERYGK